MSHTEPPTNRRDPADAKLARSEGSQSALGSGENPKPRKRQSRTRELILILVAVLYGGGLLIAPLVAIVWGSLAEGAGAFVREITSTDALSSFKLTLTMAVTAT